MELDYSKTAEILDLPLKIARENGLENEFITSLCINLMSGESDLFVAADNALREWDL